MTSQSLLGKTALVTGGGRRIGREIALGLAAAGADVTITYRNSRTEAEETLKLISEMERQAIALECDVRSEDSVRTTVANCINFHGHLDLLVNNAAIYESVALDAMSIEQWDAVFETNTRGPFLVSREALPYLRASQGRIITLGSLGGLSAWPGHAHYCASKAALHMLTEAMAKAFAPEVSVNCVAPGWIEFEEDRGQPVTERFAAKTPMQRNGSARDVAQAVIFFASTSNFITGQILTVDGGLGL